MSQNDRPLEDDVLFAVSDPNIAAKHLTGAEQEALEDAACRAKAMPTVTFDGKTFPVESWSIDYNNAWHYAGLPDQVTHDIDDSLLPIKLNGTRATVYLAGKMTGLPLYGFPIFDAARDDLTAKGFKVISPADIDREVGFDPSVGTLDDFDLPAAIRRDVDAILGCDAVVLLPGHESSKGATAERCVAKWAGIPCYTYPDLKPYVVSQWQLAMGMESVAYEPLDNSFDKMSKDDADGKTIVSEMLSQAIVDYDETFPIVANAVDERKENVLERFKRMKSLQSITKDELARMGLKRKPVVTESTETDAKANVLRDGETVTNERGGKQSYISAAFDCIPPECLRLLAQCLGFGKKKYGRDNWKNIDQEDNIAHAMNHLNEYRLGDRSEPHLVNAMARVTFALSQAVANGTQSDVYVHPDDK